MKKFLIALLALVMMFALAVPVFAEPAEVSVPGSSSADIKANYEEGTDSDRVETVYLVTVDWKINSTLVYSDGTTTYKWNANDTKYEAQAPEDKGWTGNATVEITVTNKSNAAITASAEWTDATDITAACDFVESEIEIASAATGTNLSAPDKVLEGSAQTDKIEATVEVTDGTIDADDTTVGTITVSIAAKQ